MKATFQLPNDLYREVKARSAIEGRPVRDVVISLFRQWLEHGEAGPRRPQTDWKSFEPPLRRLVPSDVMDHSMDSIRESIAKNFDETV